MAGETIELDDYRTLRDLRSAATRRMARTEGDWAREEDRRRDEEMIAQLLSAPARTWPEAALKAQYLIREFARTPEAKDPRRRWLIEDALGALGRLLARSEED